MEPVRTLPPWAPRVAQQQIRRLYETDAKGIYDDELIDEVGYALLARCQSFIEANEAVAGRVRCPACAGVVTHGRRKEDVLRCACGWELPWAQYFTTIQHKQLSGAEPVLRQFRAFTAGFPAAHTPRAKMILIDQLLHGFHWATREPRSFHDLAGPTRPVAVNLIEGSLNEVVVFLDQLTYGAQSTPGLADRRTEWNKGLDCHREWYAARRPKSSRRG